MWKDIDHLKIRPSHKLRQMFVDEQKDEIKPIHLKQDDVETTQQADGFIWARTRETEREKGGQRKIV